MNGFGAGKVRPASPAGAAGRRDLRLGFEHHPSRRAGTSRWLVIPQRGWSFPVTFPASGSLPGVGSRAVPCYNAGPWASKGVSAEGDRFFSFCDDDGSARWDCKRTRARANCPLHASLLLGTLAAGPLDSSFLLVECFVYYREADTIEFAGGFGLLEQNLSLIHI